MEIAACEMHRLQMYKRFLELVKEQHRLALQGPPYLFATFEIGLWPHLIELLQFSNNESIFTILGLSKEVYNFS